MLVDMYYQLEVFFNFFQKRLVINNNYYIIIDVGWFERNTKTKEQIN